MVISALLGLAIILSSWILVSTFLEVMGVASWTGFGRWWEIDCPVSEVPGALIPAIVATPSSGRAPLLVSFSDDSIGPRDSWQWDFGDGSPQSAAQNPSHFYKALGKHVVVLKVSGSSGGAVAFKSITVEPTFSSASDFSQGTMLNTSVPADKDQLELESTVVTKNFLWVAASGRGTIVKIDISDGAVLGEYRTAPQTVASPNPSRTTVDANGYVWVTNRDVESEVNNKKMGSVTFIGLKENNGCVDRNKNGAIDTSAGLGDIKDWDANSKRDNDLGGVSLAQDECILQYVRINSYGARHLSIDAKDTTKVWAGGIGSREWDLVDSKNGAIVRSEPSVGAGGYGGLIDKNGILWSTTNRTILRWDTSKKLTDQGSYSIINPPANKTYYGLCVDKENYIWSTILDSKDDNGAITKFRPDGSVVGTYTHGNQYAQGCVGDASGNIWVAHSLVTTAINTVGHLLSDGTRIGNVVLDASANAGPTGVAVDANGKVWATGYYTSKVYRIDPAGGAVGADGTTKIGAVDKVVGLGSGASPYNYSDMTGSTVVAPPTRGSWTVVYDSNSSTATWNKISWKAKVESPASLTVTAASASPDSGNCSDATFSTNVSVTNGVQISNLSGECLQVTVAFDRGQAFGDSPILYDLSLDWDP